MSMIIKHDELKNYVQQVQDILKHQIDSTDVNGLLIYLADICNIASNIPLMQASSKFYLEEARKKYIPEASAKGLTPQMTKEYANSLCAAELSMYEFIKELGSECDKKRSAIISMISYEKKLLESSMNTR
jgi:hypothetical protein